MAWTGGKVKVLRFLHRSNWSTHAMAVALDMSELAIDGKLKRLRAAEDPEILIADLARRIASLAGLTPLDAMRAYDVLCQPGVRAGLISLTQMQRNDDDTDNRTDRALQTDEG